MTDKEKLEMEAFDQAIERYKDELEFQFAHEFMSYKQRVCFSGAAELLSIISKDFEDSMRRKLFTTEEWDLWNKMLDLASTAEELKIALDRREQKEHIESARKTSEFAIKPFWK